MTIAYLAAAGALLLFGAFVLLDSLLKLVKAEHPPVGLVSLFGEQFWLGWLMLAAQAMHDKVLYADACAPRSTT